MQCTQVHRCKSSKKQQFRLLTQQHRKIKNGTHKSISQVNTRTENGSNLEIACCSQGEQHCSLEHLVNGHCPLDSLLSSLFVDPSKLLKLLDLLLEFSWTVGRLWALLVALQVVAVLFGS